MTDLSRLRARVPVNLLMGYLNSLVTAVVGLVTLPVYVSAVGIEDYGVVAFFLTCKTVMSAFDVGMTQTVVREMAACLPMGRVGEVRTLFVGFERITLGLACICLLAFTFGSEPIAAHLLHTAGDRSASLAWSILLIGVALATRWPSGLYQGVLIGAERMIGSSVLSIAAILIADVGIFVVWSFFTPSVELYLVWQVLIGLGYSLAARFFSFRILGKINTPTEKRARDYLLRGFTRNLALISAAGTILSQFDRFVISSFLPISNLAIYSIGVTLAASIYMAVNPTFNVMFPRFTHLFVSQAESQLQTQYGHFSRLLARMVFPGALFCVLGSKSLLMLWTHSEKIAADAAIVLSVVSISFALHGVMYAPHALVLASGNTKAILGQYAILIPLVLPFTVWCTNRYGIAGAAISQLMHFSLYLIIGSWYAHRLVLRGYLKEWILTDIAPAAAVAACFGAIGSPIISHFQRSAYTQVITSAMVAGIAASVMFALEPKVKSFWTRLHPANPT